MSKKETILKRIKIIIVGVEETGKSTLVRQLSGNAKSIEHYAKDGSSITVGFDIGVVEMDDYIMHFIGTPGQKRFEFAKKIATCGAHIGILMLDGETISEKGVQVREKTIEQELIDMNIPYLVCLNKSDVLDEAVADTVKPHFNLPIHLISAKTGQGVDKLQGALQNLIETTPMTWSSSLQKKIRTAIVKMA